MAGILGSRTGYLAGALALALMPSTAWADCGISITFKNEMNASATLDVEQTKVRTVGPGDNPIPLGVFVTFMNQAVTIPAGGQRTRNATLVQDCTAGTRDFKFFFAVGTRVIRVNKIVVTAIDRNFNVRIRD